MKNTDELHVLEKELLDPAMRGDVAFLERVLAPDFVEIGQSGRLYDKAAVISALTDEPGFDGPRRIEDFSTRQIGSGLVLAIYKIPETATLRSSIWRQIEGGWELVFHQGTRCARSLK